MQTYTNNKRKPSRDIPAHAQPPIGKLSHFDGGLNTSYDPHNSHSAAPANELDMKITMMNPSMLPSLPEYDINGILSTINTVEDVAQQFHATCTLSKDHPASQEPPAEPGAAIYPTTTTLDPLQIQTILNSQDMDADEAAAIIPKDERPVQPDVQREYFERLWAQNFERSEVQRKPVVHAPYREATVYIPVGSRARLLRISGFSLARELKTGRLYAVFRLEMECDASAKRWTIYRRYHDFKKLAAQLKAEGYRIPMALPPKTILRSFEAEFLSKRQYELQKWLYSILECSRNSNTNNHHQFTADIQDSDIMRRFLTQLANQPPALEDSSGKIDRSESNAATSASGMEDETTTKEFDALRHQMANSFSSESPSDVEECPKMNVDDFDLLRVVGKGSFGKVMLVRNQDSGNLYAMKVLSKPIVVKKKQVEHTQTERRVLASINHPFIVKLHFAFQTQKKLYFVLDYCPGGDMFFHLSRYGCFPEMMAKFYAAEITLALIHLHEHGIIYRDLKPENIMLDVEGHIKLADFGLAKEGITHTVLTNTMCGTPEYLPPEILNRNGHGKAVDWWNLGMVLYELLTGRPPWYTTDRMKLFLRLRKANLEFPDGMSEESMSLIQGLLNRNPEERLGSRSSLDLLNHAFFKGVDWQKLYNREIHPPFQPCQYTDPQEAANFEAAFTKIPVDAEENPGEGAIGSSSRNTITPSGRGSAARALSYTFQGFTFEGNCDLP